MVAIRNAPSPAATSSMAIAEHITAWLFEGDQPGRDTVSFVMSA